MVWNKQAQFYDAPGFCGSGIQTGHRMVCVCSTLAGASVWKIQRSGRNLHDGSESSIGVFTHMSKFWGHVGHLSPCPVQMSPGGHCIGFSNMANLGWLDILHVALGSKNKYKSCVALKSQCHLCSTRMVEVVRIPYPDSREGNADVTSQWQTVEEFAAMFENHHEELTVIHLFIQSTSVSQAQIPGSGLGELRRAQHIPASLEESLGWWWWRRGQSQGDKLGEGPCEAHSGFLPRRPFSLGLNTLGENS